MIVSFWTRVGALRNPLAAFSISLLALPLAAQSNSVSRESITVERLIIDAWITLPDGSPVIGLGPEDLHVRVGSKPARVEAVELHRSAGTTPRSGGGENLTAPGETTPRLFVYYFQTDFQRARVIGQMRMMKAAREMVGDLAPDDLVAVVSFDSHLKLHQDFTRDRDAILGAISRTLEIGDTPEHVESRDGPSLVAGISRGSARAAARPEKSLLLIARALLGIEGHKTLVFFGWGLGRFGAGGVVMDRDWAPARRIMEDARTTMFVLDTSDADFHSLEVGLQEAAAATGGYYQRTNRFGQQAINRLQRTLSGRYEIVVVIEGMPRGEHPVEVRLRDGIRGEVWTRRTYTLQ